MVFLINLIAVVLMISVSSDLGLSPVAVCFSYICYFSGFLVGVVLETLSEKNNP